MPANVVAGLQINIIGDVGPFAQAMDRAEQIAKKQSRAIQQAINKEMQEPKHSLALFGEAFGVGIPRHIRGFISELPGVSKAMSAAFSGLALIVLADVIVKAVEKVKQFHEALKAVEEAPAKIAEGFRRVNEPLEQTRHEMELTLAKTENAVAKLEHKPQNGLKLAIAEAAVEADKLNTKLGKAVDDIQKMLKEDNPGWAARTWTAKTGNTQAQDIAASVKEELAKIPHDKDYSTKAREVYKKAWDRAQYELDKNNTAANKAVDIYTSREDANKRYAIANASLYGLQSSLSGMYGDLDLQQQIDTENKKKDQLLASKDAQAEQIRQWEDQLANIRLQYAMHGHEMTKAEEFEFWSQRLQQTAKGGDAWNAVNKKIATDAVDIAKEYASTLAELHKIEQEYKASDLIGTGDGLKANNKYVEDWIKASQHGAAISQQNANALEQANIHFDEANGTITKLGAAQRLAALHAKEHSDAITKLSADLAALDKMNISDSERKARQQKIQNDIDTENGHYKVTQINDAAALQASMRGMFDGFNAQFTNAMTGKKTDFGHVFSQTGSSLINSSLHKIESGIFSKLGFGKLGTRANPMITQDVNSAGTVASLAGGLGGKLGGFLGKIGSFFGGFFADGGSPDPYKASIVGERGPELFVPRGVSGQVISNNQLSRSLGAGGHVTYNIDATGTNAAEVDMRVKQGMIMAHNQAVQSTQMAMQERQRRVPSSKRGA